MRKLKFHYRTVMRFDPPVCRHSYAVRCVPVDTQAQKIQIESRYVKPADSLNETVDGFGNHRYVGYCQGYHSEFEYEVRGVAEVESMVLQKEALHPIFKYPSKFTKHEPEVVELYRKMCPLEGDELQRAVFMMNYLYEHFEYVPGVTNIDTTAAEAIRLGKGVCQDYAHIMIALCRFARIPARYVVGMMIGEGATHAWVEIYYNHGWYGLDPTNNLHVDDYYIKIAHGRDYEDCVVDRGRFYGPTTQHQEVYVQVEEIE